MLEIERKFLISKDDFNYIRNNTYMKSEMGVTQYYTEGVDPEVRIRQCTNSDGYLESCELTSKIKISDISRIEINKEISLSEYEDLRDSGMFINGIFKLRYVFYDDSISREYIVDSIKNGCIHILEVEFKSEDDCKNFNPPDYFGVEVTNNPEYSSYNLARNNRVESDDSSANNLSDFYHIINSSLMKMDNVIRYSGTYQINQELLSTHIVDIQFMSLIIMRNLIKYGEFINIGDALEKCLVHDMDEVLIGDIPRLTKYSSKICHDALNAVADKVSQDISLSVDNSDYTYQLWKNAKDLSIEGYIVKLCDMLSVVKKVINEVEMLNNNNFLRVGMEVSNYIKDMYDNVPVDLFFKKESIQYIKNIIKGAEITLNEIVSNHSDIIRKFNIENTTTKFIIDNRYSEDNDK